MNSIIPKFMFEIEDVVTLKDKGIKIQEGHYVIGTYKVPCYKIYNMSEIEVFDELYKDSLLESTNNNQLMSYANRVMSLIFMRIRQVNAITNKDLKLVAICALLASVNSLALIDVNQANRFLPMLRSMQ